MIDVAGLQRTDGSGYLVAARVIAGAPLLVFGILHLVGAMPLTPIVEAAGLPAPSVMATLGPAGQVVAGLLLLPGVLTRIGSILAIGLMLGAILAHARIPNDRWPNPDGGTMQEPVAMMGLAALIIIAALITLWKGAGSWSIDRRCTQNVAGD